MKHRKIPTSAEVWAAIKARHGNDLHVFSSYSAPNGDQFGDRCVMETDYGFQGADCPLMGARTTWDKLAAGAHGERPNERHEYWLFAAVEE